MTASTSRRRKLLAIGLVALVLATVGVVSSTQHARERDRVDNWMDRQAELVEGVIGDSIERVFTNLIAARAFVEQTDPTSPEFAEFVDRLDGTANAVGVGYFTIVPAEDVESYLQHQHVEQPYLHEVFGLNADGSRMPVDSETRTEFYPLEMFAIGDMIRPYLDEGRTPDQLGLGLDIGYDPVWREDVAAAAMSSGPALSRFIDIKLEVVPLNQVFFASVPVRRSDGTPQGFVAALMLEPLLLRDLDNPVLSDVQWELVAHGGTPGRVTGQLQRSYVLEMPGAAWTLAIAPTDQALKRLRGQPWWLVTIVAGVLAALATLSLWLLVDRRTERSRLRRFKQVADDKDRFLATVSHELRTPLTVVSGVANELRDRRVGFSPEEEASLLTMLVDQSDELAAIVEDLLIAARSDIGKVVIHYQETDLGAEVDRAIAAAGMMVPQHGSAGVAWADGQRVGQILRNLLTNARRYGGPAVHVEFSASPNSVAVVVADNGSAVPGDSQETMFEAYRSAHNSKQIVQSVGLGLYISRNLARAMGGDLDYEHDGQCSRFRLCLPAVDEAARRDAGVARGVAVVADAVPIGQTSAVRFSDR